LSDIRLDDDYVDGLRGGTSPVHRLLVAIVRRAVWDFVLYENADQKKNPNEYELYVDAVDWLFWDGEEECDGEGRLTFRHICSTLELDPRQIRQIALTMSRSDIQRLNNNIKE
jgi:hypothetical protein